LPYIIIRNGKVRTSKQTFISVLILTAIVCLSIGVVAFYIPNTSKPLFLARDPLEDIIYVFASIPKGIRHLLGMSPIMSAADFIQTSPTPMPTVQNPEAYFAEQVVQANAIVNTIISEIPNAQKEYVSYAAQHGVDSSQSWTVELILVSSDGKVRLADMWIQYDASSQSIHAFLSQPAIIGASYHVVLDNTAGEAFEADYASRDFLAASKDFVWFSMSGELEWWTP
jgi:hypothetical protein